MVTRHPATADTMVLTRVLFALSDPLRLGLVQLLADGTERRWGELDVPVSKSTLSHHLKVLRSAGVTETRDEGTRCFVRLRRDDLDERFPGLLAAVLDAITDEATPVQVTPVQTTSDPTTSVQATSAQATSVRVTGPAGE